MVPLILNSSYFYLIYLRSEASHHTQGMGGYVHKLKDTSSQRPVPTPIKYEDSSPSPSQQPHLIDNVDISGARNRENAPQVQSVIISDKAPQMSICPIQSILPQVRCEDPSPSTSAQQPRHTLNESIVPADLMPLAQSMPSELPPTNTP